MGYQDYLQTPLQPLEFNLESATYEIFEKDPVKYGNYERAIELALRDRPADKKMYSHLYRADPSLASSPWLALAEVR